jgi:hypothetical protein
MMIQLNAQAAGLAARVHSAPRFAFSVTTSGLRRCTLS